MKQKTKKIKNMKQKTKQKIKTSTGIYRGGNIRGT